MTLVFLLCCSLWSFNTATLGKHDGQQISEIDITSDGPITEVSLEDLSKLILLQEGDVFSSSKARATISLLHQTGFFFDIQITTRTTGSGETQ